MSVSMAAAVWADAASGSSPSSCCNIRMRRDRRARAAHARAPIPNAESSGRPSLPGPTAVSDPEGRVTTVVSAGKVRPVATTSRPNWCAGIVPAAGEDGTCVGVGVAAADGPEATGGDSGASGVGETIGPSCSGRVRVQPVRIRPGSVKRTPPGMVRPRFIAAMAGQSPPSPSCVSAIVHSESPGWTTYAAEIAGWNEEAGSTPAPVVIGATGDSTAGAGVANARMRPGRGSTLCHRCSMRPPPRPRRGALLPRPATAPRPRSALRPSR